MPAAMWPKSLPQSPRLSQSRRERYSAPQKHPAFGSAQCPWPSSPRIMALEMVGRGYGRIGGTASREARENCGITNMRLSFRVPTLQHSRVPTLDAPLTAIATPRPSFRARWRMNLAVLVRQSDLVGNPLDQRHRLKAEGSLHGIRSGDRPNTQELQVAIRR